MGQGWDGEGGGFMSLWGRGKGKGDARSVLWCLYVFLTFLFIFKGYSIETCIYFMLVSQWSD